MSSHRPQSRPLTPEAFAPVKILEDDPHLHSYAQRIFARRQRFRDALSRLEADGRPLEDHANGHHFFGFHRQDGGWLYREWAPQAQSLALIGEFNDWNRASHPLRRAGGPSSSVWETFVPDGPRGLFHGCKLKVHVVSGAGAMDRIPLYVRRSVQDPVTLDFSGQLWAPDAPFAWTDSAFRMRDIGPLLIYEAHVGLASEEERIGTYVEFAERILPRIKAAGYTAIQLMGVMEHPYYGSFGYHVSNFFAASSRFGTPEELKLLINRAHEMKIGVLLDLVHSHAVKNVLEGINRFDGTDTQFFHAGTRGDHPAWDSKLFDYGKPEVVHFLLSNVKYWMEEFHFDGFRFDGVTSMLYTHHGLGRNFTHYDMYFGDDTDHDAIVYLQLATSLMRRLKPDSIAVAEDMSGMPGMALRPEDGGVGFDFRLAMGLPDFWKRTLEDTPLVEHWDLHALWHELTNRRRGEKSVAYAESHDQSIVGDQALAFRLMGAAMYEHMRVDDSHAGVRAGIELHKLVRLLTFSLSGEAYLNFIGNEFGHPEWVDFPREGNGWSHKYCRRQWALAEDPTLKYRFLGAFDAQMLQLAVRHPLLQGGRAQPLRLDAAERVLVYLRGGLLFAFNLHPSRTQLRLDAFESDAGRVFQCALATHDAAFGGHEPVMGQTFVAAADASSSAHIGPGGVARRGTLSLVLPPLSAMVIRQLS